MAKAKQTHRPPSQAKGAAAQRNGAARPAGSGARANNSARASNGAAAGQTGKMPVSPRSERIQARANQRRRYQQVPWWRQNNLPIFGAIGVVVVLIAIFFYMANRPTGGGGTNAQAAPAGVINPVTNVSPQVISTVGTGGVKSSLAAVPPSAGGGNLVANGKPVVLYMGAEYCPYCAAERWSMIIALSRFCTFSNLHLTTSSSTDIYPDTPTFTFYGSSYTSKYIDFQSVEETTRDQTALQSPTDQQQKLLSTYDTAQYVGSNLANGIPFIDFGNQYVQVSSGYSPQVLTGLTQQDIASKLGNASDPVTQQIVGEANYLTAAICKLTNNQPSNVCTAAPMPQIVAQLPKGQS